MAAAPLTATAAQISVVLTRQVPLPLLPEVRVMLLVICFAIHDAMMESRGMSSNRIEARRWLRERRYRYYAELLNLDTEAVADLIRRAGCQWIDTPDLPPPVVQKPPMVSPKPRKPRCDIGKSREFYKGVSTAVAAPADSSRH